jgi:hypothetical protein
MKIRDITMRDIQQGKVWRLSPPAVAAALDLPLEEWGPIEETAQFAPDDHVIYSGLVVYRSGGVKAIVCVREVQYLDYGGAYCEFVNGCWQRLGLKPNPNAEPGAEFIASPLAIDPSFEASNHDFRKYHRDNFRTHVGKLSNEEPGRSV